MFSYSILHTRFYLFLSTQNLEFHLGNQRSVQFSRSVVSDSLRPHELQHARPPCPSPTPGVHSKFTSVKSLMPSSHVILCRPLLLLPSIPPSIRLFPNESTLCMRWPKYWSFSFSSSPSKDIPGLISFRMDWLDLLLQSKGLSRIFSNTTVRRHQFFSTQPSFGEGNGNPFQYSCLENPRDGGA